MADMVRDWLPNFRQIPADEAARRLLAWLVERVWGIVVLLFSYIAARWMVNDPALLEKATRYDVVVATLAIAVCIAIVWMAIPWGIVGFKQLSGHHATTPQPSAANVLPVIPVVRTAEIDIPDKITALSALLGVLDNGLPFWINKGNALSTGGWWNSVVGGKTRELRSELIGWRDDHSALARIIDDLGHSYRVFPDIFALTARSYADAFIPRMERFVGVIASLGDNPNLGHEALNLLIRPIAEEMYKGLEDVEKWRKNAASKAIELRQRLSQ